MEKTKEIKRLKTIGVIILSLGILITLSNGIPYLVLKLADSSIDELLVSPLFFLITGIFLIIGGIFVINLKKFGWIITQIFSIIFAVLWSIHTLTYTNKIETEFFSDVFVIIISIIMMTIIVIPVVFLIYYLNKSSIKNLFT